MQCQFLAPEGQPYVHYLGGGSGDADGGVGPGSCWCVVRTVYKDGNGPPGGPGQGGQQHGAVSETVA